MLHALYIRVEKESTIQLFNELRDTGVVDSVARLVPHPEPAVHQLALLLIACLTTDDIDPSATETRHLMRDGHLFEDLKAHIFSDESLTAAFACGAIQNLCSDRRLAMSLRRQKDAVERLRILAACKQPQVSQAAAACLHNLKAVVQKMRPAPVLAAVSLKSLRRTGSHDSVLLLPTAADRCHQQGALGAASHARVGSSPISDASSRSQPLRQQTRQRTARGPQYGAVTRRQLAEIASLGSMELSASMNANGSRAKPQARQRAMKIAMTRRQLTEIRALAANAIVESKHQSPQRVRVVLPPLLVPRSAVSC